MREIKFRAWGKIVKRMFNWGDFRIKTFIKGGWSIIIDQVPRKREDIILMQFTGLKDKNSKEIYEGDIVEINAPETRGKKRLEEVIWFKDKEHIEGNGFCLSGSEGWNLNEIKVIGNIYENPEIAETTGSGGRG